MENIFLLLFVSYFSFISISAFRPNITHKVRLKWLTPFLRSHQVTAWPLAPHAPKCSQEVKCFVNVCNFQSSQWLNYALGASSTSGGSSPTKVSRVVSKPTSSKSSSSSLQRSFTKSISSVLFEGNGSGKSLTEREISNTSHESGFFSAVGHPGAARAEINQTFPRRRKNASRTSLLVLQADKMSGVEDESSVSGSSSHVDQLHLNSIQHSFLPIKPLHFEIPRSSQASSGLVGRQWLQREIQTHLTSHLPTNRGVIIRGGPGTGKTELILSLVEKSAFGRAIRGELKSRNIFLH